MAAIDCGTNSLRLLIAERDSAGRLVDVDRRMRIVRLGQGVDETGRLHPDALERTRAVLAEYAALVAATGVEAVRMVATSAVRDAANRADFDALVRAVLGDASEVVSGVEEARLSFAGARSALPADIGAVLVADIGGGSTELVSGGSEVASAVSLDVGSVRLTERHVRHDPVLANEVRAIAADVRGALSPVRPGATQLIGVAGTVTTVAALALDLPAYDSARIEGARLSRALVDATVDQLVGSTREQRRAGGVIHPGRVDVIVAGALILQTLMAYLDAPDLVVTEHDILDGIALGLFAHRP